MKNIEKLLAMEEAEQYDYLFEVIRRWAGLNGMDGSYIHDLTRTKEAYSIGTMMLDDFTEWDDSRIAEVAQKLCDWLNDEYRA